LGLAALAAVAAGLAGSPAMARAGALRGLLADSVQAGDLAAWGKSDLALLACSLDRGDTLLALHADRRLIPGSNAKLYGTGAFLRQYGVEARFPTRIGARGKVSLKGKAREAELKGDLILRGSGIPDILPLLRPGSKGLLDTLAVLLRASGLTRFEGTLWVDGTLFAREPYGPGWALEDIPYSYGAAVNAILANGNGATLIATSTPKGVAYTLDPPETPLTITGKPAVVDPGQPVSIDFDRMPGSSVLRVRGAIPRGGSVKRQVSVPAPDSTAGLFLLGSMRRAGIEVKADVRVINGPEGIRDSKSQSAVDRAAAWTGGDPETFGSVKKDAFRTVASVLSPTAAEVAGVVNAWSLNAEADALSRHLDPAPREKSRARGVRGVLAAIAAAGIDTTDVALVDGSGLSPYDLTTARALVSWLTIIDRDPLVGAPFREGLARPGASGTLKNRFGGSGDLPSLRGKTGTLTNVSGISGYVTSAEGERIVFAILSNGNRGSLSGARAAEERMVELLARFHRPPPLPARPPIGIPR
jgi:D-alanyl-D-alanine carboxypeptidase/D-alanyl-D-alanine-endopeptidase (penicillin-binding protein 4)